MTDDPLFPAGSCCGRSAGPAASGNAARPWWLRLIVGRSLKRTLMRAAVLGLCCGVMFKFAVRPAWTDGESMEPTVRDKRLHFINLLAYRVGEPRRHDIVAIRGTGDHFLYLKRVLGLPGETVEFRSGRLLVDGGVIEEPYVKQDGDWTLLPVTLAANEYYVAGDNRAMPMNLHLTGVTRRRHLEGKLLL